MKISQDVIEVLTAAEIDGNKLILTGQLDRKLYMDVNKVLTAIGGKWNTKAKAHIFGEDITEMVDQIVNTGEYRSVKVDLQQFDTPQSLTKQVIALADIFPGAGVLEPSVGIGNMAMAANEAGATLHGYEIDPKRYQYAQDRCFFEGGLILGDFLKTEPEPVFDRVVMNPPFTRGQDVDHVMHALKFLKPGGVLVSIMSNGVRFRQDKRYTAFRSLVEERGEIIDVEAGAFRDSGTMVNTCIVRIAA